MLNVGARRSMFNVGRAMLADAHGFEGDFDFDVRFFDGTVDSEVQFVP